MKRIILIVFLAFFTACFNPPSLKTGLEGTSLPSFSLLLMDSITTFDIGRLLDGKPVILFYFSPYCPYCRAQTEAFINNMKSLKNIQFCLLADAPFPDIKNYYEQYQLSKYANVIVGQDYKYFFAQYFKTQVVPYIAIYDNSKRLKQIVIGRIKPGAIIDIIHG